MFDPYFNVSFVKRDGELVGAFDIQKALFNGTIREIQPVFYGEVKYPRRIQNYYIDWAILYNNAWIYEKKKSSIFKMPIFRWFQGTKAKFVKLPNVSMSDFNLLNRIYFFFTVLLPITILLEGLIILILVIYSIKLKRSKRRLEQC